jgi:hypothetical protein
MEEVVCAPIDADDPTDAFAAARNLICSETEKLLASFIKLERLASAYRPPETDVESFNRYLALVKDMLSGYNSMPMEHLLHMTWLSPILLGSCIQSRNPDILGMVQKFVQRTSPPPQPYPDQRPPPPVLVSEEAAHGQSPNDDVDASMSMPEIVSSGESIVEPLEAPASSESAGQGENGTLVDDTADSNPVAQSDNINGISDSDALKPSIEEKRVATDMQLESAVSVD